MYRMLRRIVVAVLAGLLVAGSGFAVAVDKPEYCRSGKLPAGDGTKDLVIEGHCTVQAGTGYKYKNVNIINGGALTFTDAVIDFWATSILVENNGKLIAGSAKAPIGMKKGRVTIHLYGPNQGENGRGIACLTDERCGVPGNTWRNDGKTKVALPGGIPNDYFYQYGPLSYDGGDPEAYYGYKVLGVGYGGTLQLFGKKGTPLPSTVEPASGDSGTSWVRLATTLLPSKVNDPKAKIRVDRAVDWEAGDRIVVTTTDYLPGHSEEFTIDAVEDGGKTLTVSENVQFRHQGEVYSLPADTTRLKLNMSSVETRAAVGLLSRSIRIVSEGDTIDDRFPPETTPYHFGGHTIVRQGVQSYQVQGVEFKQLGQGGRIGHYPVHFHRVRQVPKDTFVKDSTINESMTRFIVLHATSGVTLARNVGYKSIGHGFYLEEGTETDNRLLTNLGIFARAAIDNVQNPRKVPGILAAKMDPAHPENVPFYSDYDHPSVFWIMNGWNDFEYNMAAGAGSCGMCYWLVPGAISGHSRHQKWEGYASMQASHNANAPLERAAMTPLRKFVGNSCSTAMNSFITIGNTTACQGVAIGQKFIPAIENPLAPKWCNQDNPRDKNGLLLPIACAHPSNVVADDYYPKVTQGGGRFATLCTGTDCSKVPKCSAGSLATCMITAIDRYTTSFNWAETNFSAIFLRPQWYLLSNSAITDVQQGGLSFVTGGGYTASDVVPGHWALVRKSVFIGNTQAPVTLPDQKDFASNAGPFNPKGLACDGDSGNYCLSVDEGVPFPNSNFGMNQRLFNIYDGPSYQESNAYLDITSTPVTDCTLAPPNAPDQKCGSSKFLAGRVLGLPWDPIKLRCYMPNAAIGWKQPNGFYYPPAFHSNNLYFKNVDTRHYVVEPQFLAGSYDTDLDKARAMYCNFNNALFNGFTDVDRQTELSDDDGSLTGYSNTVSVNLDPFFNAPVETVECASDNTAKTSPYSYITTVMYPQCAVGSGAACEGTWGQACTTPDCAGVPMYRQLRRADETNLLPMRMSGQATFQRSTLTANNGKYYIDTTVSAVKQRQAKASSLNVFVAGGTYHTFLLFATPKTAQTYQLYVGKGFNPDLDVWAERADIGTKPPTFNRVSAFPAGWGRGYDGNTGILTVTMNMSFPQFATEFTGAHEGHCQPQSFCSWDKTKSVCGCNPASAMFGLCDDRSNDGKDVCSWTAKDVDCPNGGCYGFGVKMAANFSYDPVTPARPAQACITKAANPEWVTTFQPATGGIAGNCPQVPIPADGFCE